jgi:hypothetical protein
MRDEGRIVATFVFQNVFLMLCLFVSFFLKSFAYFSVVLRDQDHEVIKIMGCRQFAYQTVSLFLLSKS